MGKITDCLDSFRENRNASEEELYALTYATLRRIAAKRASGISSVTPTELVHEAWLRLSKADCTAWIDSKHFFNAAASAMRYALVDAIRHQNRLKRGAGFSKADWSEGLISVDPLGVEIECLHEALEAFEIEHPDKAEVQRTSIYRVY